jgi:hypothetical protein
LSLDVLVLAHTPNLNETRRLRDDPKKLENAGWEKAAIEIDYLGRLAILA